MSDYSKGHVAYVHDADEDDKPIEGTEKYAASTTASPMKQLANTRRERRRRNSESPDMASDLSDLSDSVSTEHPNAHGARKVQSDRASRNRDRARERGRSHDRERANKKAVVTARPGMKHTPSAPAVPSGRRESRMDASYFAGSHGNLGFGRNHSIMEPVLGGRPHAVRPTSYYGHGHPPRTNQEWYIQRQMHQPPMGALPPSYPPQPWAQGPVPYAVAQVPPSPMPSYVQPPYAQPPYVQPPYAPAPYDYPHHGHRPLEYRFGPTHRPASTTGIASRPLYPSELEDDEQEHRRLHVRRATSQRKQSRTAMAPPPRPISAMPAASPFWPPSHAHPATPTVGRTRRLDDEDERSALFHVSPHINPDNPFAPKLQPRAARKSLGARSMTYDVDQFRTEFARNTKKNSLYRERTTSLESGDLEHKLKDAAAYQSGMGGGFDTSPTIDLVRKTRKNTVGTRSARSSGSHDESEYRQSATTKTTRSSNNDEDVTILVKGTTSLRVGGADIQCKDGAEINIISRGPGSVYRGGSDRSSYIDPAEERQTRVERPALRARTHSQATTVRRHSMQMQPLRRPPSDAPYEEYQFSPYEFRHGAAYHHNYNPMAPPPPVYPSDPSHYRYYQ